MSKKVKVLMAGLVAILLIAAVPAGIALADEETTVQGPSVGILERVAGILGISADDLTAAFQQAREEVREECLATGNCTEAHERISNRFAERQADCNEDAAGNAERFQQMRGHWQDNDSASGNSQGGNRQAGRGQQSAAAATGVNVQPTMALETVVR